MSHIAAGERDTPGINGFPRRKICAETEKMESLFLIIRYRAIMHPLRRKPSKLFSKAVIVMIWVLSLAFALPMGLVHTFGYVQDQSKVSRNEKRSAFLIPFFPSLLHVSFDPYVCHVEFPFSNSTLLLLQILSEVGDSAATIVAGNSSSSNDSSSITTTAEEENEEEDKDVPMKPFCYIDLGEDATNATLLAFKSYT